MFVAGRNMECLLHAWNCFICRLVTFIRLSCLSACDIIHSSSLTLRPFLPRPSQPCFITLPNYRSLEKHENCFKVPYDPRRKQDMMTTVGNDDDDDEEAHEYDIVVCHGNVIR